MGQQCNTFDTFIEKFWVGILKSITATSVESTEQELVSQLVTDKDAQSWDQPDKNEIVKY